MAVQAQYPSNVLLLNRSVQEMKNPIGNSDYKLQPQPGGGFIDQSHMFFNNGNGVGTNNTRKRARESTSTMVPINPFSIQIQSPQQINLSQIQNPQPNIVSTGLQLASGNQLQKQHHHHHHYQQSQQTFSPQFCSSVQFSLLSDDLGTQIRQQTEEIEHFLQSQAEQLRRTLAEKMQGHYRVLLGAVEESASRRLREKEAEAEVAVRRHAELEAQAVQLGAEAQAWQAKARAQEEAAAFLQAQLQQAIMSGSCARQLEDGGMGLECAGGIEGPGQADDAESGYVDPDLVVVTSGRLSCKACRRRPATVVLLPCRHFCLCTECDEVAQTCPACLSVRDNSIEVFIS